MRIQIYYVSKEILQKGNEKIELFALYNRIILITLKV